MYLKKCNIINMKKLIPSMICLMIWWFSGVSSNAAKFVTFIRFVNGFIRQSPTENSIVEPVYS